MRKTTYNYIDQTYVTGAYIAHKAVTCAVKRGELPPAKALNCVDCGCQARDYDHRDYNAPMVVVPVCRRCNRLRGPATPKAWESKEAFDAFFEKCKTMRRYANWYGVAFRDSLTPVFASQSKAA